MKQGLKHLVFSAVMIIAGLTCIVIYGVYTQRMIYQESTRDVLAVYEQVNKTFTMFAQRNWNILSNWADELEKLSHEEENGEDGGTSVARRWSEYVERKTNWQYSEVVLFNQNRQYRTVTGRSGDAPHMTEAVEELYAAEGPIVTSHISSRGVRKVMFAQRVHPIVMDGVIYDALVICYGNSTLENMIGGLAFEGCSDCYIVRANGEVVLSAEPKTALPQRVDNLFAFLEQDTDVSREQLDRTRANLQELDTGSLRFCLNDGGNVLSGLSACGIPGLVHRGHRPDQSGRFGDERDPEHYHPAADGPVWNHPGGHCPHRPGQCSNAAGTCREGKAGA